MAILCDITTSIILCYTSKETCSWTIKHVTDPKTRLPDTCAAKSNPPQTFNPIAQLLRYRGPLGQLLRGPAGLDKAFLWCDQDP